MKQCPKCRNEKGYFVGHICGDCFAQGKDLAGSEEGKMPTGKMERRACAKGCGKMLDPRGAHKHERVCDGPQGGGSSSRALPARRGAHLPATDLAGSAKRHTSRDGDALTLVMPVGRITDELQAIIADCQRAIELVGLAARRIEGRQE